MITFIFILGWLVLAMVSYAFFKEGIMSWECRYYHYDKTYCWVKENNDYDWCYKHTFLFAVIALTIWPLFFLYTIVKITIILCNEEHKIFGLHAPFKFLNKQAKF